MLGNSLLEPGAFDVHLSGMLEPSPEAAVFGAPHALLPLLHPVRLPSGHGFLNASFPSRRKITKSSAFTSFDASYARGQSNHERL
jgi:hypothetical protein